MPNFSTLVFQCALAHWYGLAFKKTKLPVMALWHPNPERSNATVKNLVEAELYFGWLHITPVQNGKWILHFMTFVFSLSLLSKWNHAVCISCSKGSAFHQHVAKQDDKLCWLIFSLIRMPLFQSFLSTCQRTCLLSSYMWYHLNFLSLKLLHVHPLYTAGFWF